VTFSFAEKSRQPLVRRPGGTPLAKETRDYFEPRFGHDFGKVRVHADREAAEAARREHARAFVEGEDIVFGAGQYKPGTADGQRVLGHELAHIVQRSRGGVTHAGADSISGVAEPGRIQRLDIWDVVDVLQWTNPLTFSQKLLRRTTGLEVNLPILVEQTVKLSASRISVPLTYFGKIGEYAAHAASDGAILMNALDQGPNYYQGGWLLGVQSAAEAITFGNSIFFNDDPPTLETFVHELVHINQYDRLGRDAFLTSYFGLSLAVLFGQIVSRQPVDVMKSSPHEAEAYALEKRFAAWHAAHP